MDAAVPAAGPPCRRLFVLGFLLGLIPLGGLAETFLQKYPPQDLHDFIGDDCPHVRPFRSDPDFVVHYRSWEAFQADYAERLAGLGPLDGGTDKRPVWAFFGNSFAECRRRWPTPPRPRSPTGVFSTCAERAVSRPAREIELLLEHGLRPERIFLVLMPVDSLVLGPQPLDTWYVTEKGAITFRPAGPPDRWAI